jgi:hypothetical protein
MAKYIVNKNAQPTGEHEVHAEQYCSYLPYQQDRILLGEFTSCTAAINAAHSKLPGYKIDGCYHCIPQCHTR